MVNAFETHKKSWELIDVAQKNDFIYVGRTLGAKLTHNLANSASPSPVAEPVLTAATPAANFPTSWRTGFTVALPPALLAGATSFTKGEGLWFLWTGFLSVIFSEKDTRRPEKCRQPTKLAAENENHALGARIMALARNVKISLRCRLLGFVRGRRNVGLMFALNFETSEVCYVIVVI